MIIPLAKKSGRSGSAVIVVLVVLAIISLLSLASARVALSVRAELKRIEQKQQLKFVPTSGLKISKDPSSPLQPAKN